MATSRLGRLFGRRSDDEREAETAPPAYTGMGAPRPYDPPPGSPPPPPPPDATTGRAPSGPPAATRSMPRPRSSGGSSGPAPSPYEHAPVVTRSQYDEAARRRHAADQQVGVFERFEAKLTSQIHEATEAGRDDYVRELLARRISVRSRLEEAMLRRNRLAQREEELGQGLDAREAPARGRR